MSHDAERAYVQSMLDLADDRFNETIRSMTTDLQRLRDSWADSYAEHRQAHEERLATIHDETRAWIKGLYADDGDNERTAGGHEDVASVLKDASTGHNGPQQWPTPDPREADAIERDRLAAMDMATYAEERRNLIRVDPGMFGETSR